MTPTDLATILVPVGTAVAGVLGIAWQDWGQRRSKAARRKLVMEDAIRQVTFVEQWWKAKQAMESAPDPQSATTARALSLLDDAQRLTGLAGMPATVSDDMSLTRRLLLWQPFTSVPAKVLRIVFYGLLALIVVTLLVLLGNVLAGEPISGPGESTQDTLAWTTVWSIVFGLVTIVIRAFAVASDEAKQRRLRRNI